MGRELFGTDGIRGVVNQHPMTVGMAGRVGAALGALCRREGGGRPLVLIGKDTRASGDALEHALAAGLAAVGCDVGLLGVVPTPAVAWHVKESRACAGVVVSASHNPYHDNGIKLFDGQGFKLDDEAEALVEAWALGARSLPMAEPARIGRIRRVPDAVEKYVGSLLSLADGLDASRLTVVLDCANGAAFEAGPMLFERLGAEVVALGVEPDGVNINEGVGALHPDHLADMVVRTSADLGVALDGDADRVIMCDEAGNVVDGDRLLAIFARDLHEAGRLPHETVVATEMSNLGLELALREQGLVLHRTKVGDRYVVQAMRERGLVLGGEQSGHLVFLDHGTTGDGLLAALRAVVIMLRTGSPLSKLGVEVRPVPQVLLNVPVESKPRFEELSEVMASVERVRGELGGRGRVLLRYSGTEPVARVMVEGLERDAVERYARVIADAVARAIGRA